MMVIYHLPVIWRSNNPSHPHRHCSYGSCVDVLVGGIHCGRYSCVDMLVGGGKWQHSLWSLQLCRLDDAVGSLNI